ncbi:diguanylate cyclase [Crenobacter cavernae]|uniref:diguanylate cyclase n=1 Tax=Crenobacter cavernae TaxID=2290923 RepID=UPI00100E6F51|nr:diguanylate cyclase [Crenobacter cavernae]
MSKPFARAGAARGQLKTRITLLLLLAGLALLAVQGGLFYREATAELRAQLNDYLTTQVGAVVTDLDDRLAQRSQLLEAAAKSVGVDADTLPAEAPRLAARFAHLNALFDSVVIVDADGRIVGDAPPLPGRVGLNVQFREYFQRSLRTLKPVLSEPFRARTSGNRSLVALTAPLLDEEGRFAGMLVGTIDLFSPEFFGDFLHFKVGHSGYLTVSSVRSRTTLFHPDASRIMQPVAQPDENPLMQRALAGWQGVAESRHGRGGARALYAYRPLSSANWVVGAVLPADEAYAPIARLTRVLLVSGGLVGAVLIALAWLVLRRLLRPLDTLREQVEALHEGRYTGPLSPGGGTELQAVADAVSGVFAERQAAEAALADREAFFRTLNETSPLGVLVVSAGGEIAYCNQAAHHLLSHDGTPPLGRSWFELVAVDERDEVASMWSAAVAMGAPVRFSCALEAEPAPLLTLRFQAMPGDGPARYVGVLLDISAEEAARQALSMERERALAILESIREAVVLTNHLGEVEYLNPPALAMLDQRPFELSGRPFNRVARFVDCASGHPLNIGTLSIDGGARQVDLVRDDGTRFAVEVTVSRVGGAQGFEDYRVVVIQDDAPRREREATHRWEALHDPLTRLCNRRGFHQALSVLLADEMRRGGEHAVVMLDLDHFKAVNDGGGHLLGDALLQEVAKLIALSLRASDVVARLGGDEFALLLYDCPLAVAERLLSDLLSALGNYRLEGPDGQLYRISASIGYTRVKPDDQIPADPMARADVRCYAAKHGGRNRLVMSGD